MLPARGAAGDRAAAAPDDQDAAPARQAAGAGQSARRAWREWRRSRPFWGGLLLIVAGSELLLIPLPLGSLGLILHVGIGGVLGILIGSVMILCALLLWFHPVQRTFYSIVAILLAIAALIASNLGGFFLGTLLGVIGGSLGFAWVPDELPERGLRQSPPPPDQPSEGLALILGDAEPGAGRRRSADSGSDHAWPAEGETRPGDDETWPGAGGALLAIPVVPVALAMLIGMLHAPAAQGDAVPAARPAPTPMVTASPAQQPFTSANSAQPTDLVITDG
jgi:hypothetical protein